MALWPDEWSTCSVRVERGLTRDNVGEASSILPMSSIWWGREDGSADWNRMGDATVCAWQ